MIPEFYARNDKGIPAAWVARMRESMARLRPRFAASRTVSEYTEQHCLPAARAYRMRAAGKGALARELVDWRNELAPKWASLRFGSLTVVTKGEIHVITVEVFLNDVSPDAIRVELYADGAPGDSAVRQEMSRLPQPADGKWGCNYRTTVSSARPASDYTARIMPHSDGLAVPLEAGWILWQR